MKHSLKFAVIMGLFTMAIGVNGCQKDDEAIVKGPVNEQLTSAVITFEEFKKNTEAYNELMRVMSEPVPKALVPQTGGYYYDNQRILQIDSKDYITYTFAVYRQAISNNVENLVIRQTKGGGTNSYFFRYKLTAQDRLNLINNVQITNLRTKTTLTKSPTGTGPENDYIYKDSDGNCYVLTWYDADGNYIGDTGLGPIRVYVTCPDDVQENSNYTFVTNPNQSGGGGGLSLNITILLPSNPGANPIYYPSNPGYGVPPANQGVVITKPFVNALYENWRGGLTQAQKTWLHQNFFGFIVPGLMDLLENTLGNIAERKALATDILDFAMENEDNIYRSEVILDYLNESDDPDKLEFAKEILDGIKNISQNNYPGDDDGLPYEWWLDENFVEDLFNQDPYDVWRTLTAKEKKLVKGFPNEAYIVYKNKAIAEQHTHNKFGSTPQNLNGKPDAFRHAFYQAANTVKLRKYWTELFATAHESEVPSNLILEKQMDLYNNEKGMDFIEFQHPNWTDLNQISNGIYQILIDGELYYLHPIDYSAIDFYYNHGIGPNTVLKPTDE